MDTEFTSTPTTDWWPVLVMLVWLYGWTGTLLVLSLVLLV